jgi:hypothetical protein
VIEIAPGLRRWTVGHEEWGEEVGCVAVETDDGLVLIDPLDPPAALASPEHVLLTVFFHLRSTEAVGAPHVWAGKYSTKSAANRGVTVTDDVAAGNLPGGIAAFPTARRAEVVYWLPEQRSVVVGDVLLGAGAKPKATDEPLRLCPDRGHQDFSTTIVRLPRCSGRERASTVPPRTAAKKFVFDSIVAVVLDPSGRLRNAQ